MGFKLNEIITSQQIWMIEPQVAPAVVNQCEIIVTNIQQQLVVPTLETFSHCYSNISPSLEIASKLFRFQF